MEVIAHKTWLLDGFFHSAPGLICIEDNKFKFSLVGTGTFSKSRLNKFECYKGLSHSFEKLADEQVVDLMYIDLKDIVIKFPWYNFMGGAVLNFKGHEQKLQLSFMQPQNTKFPYHKLDNSLAQLLAIESGVDDLQAGRAFGKRLKSILCG